jgi:hypothetical protein
MKYKKVPIDLILYRCLEEPLNLFQNMIENGKSRWRYPFDIFDATDFEQIGIRVHHRKDPFYELKSDILGSLDQEEVVFLSVNPFYLPHREENQDGRHWLMVVGYDQANKYLIMDEEYTYYATFEYEEEVLAEAFSNGPQHLIYFSPCEPFYEKLKESYLQFYKQYNREQDVFFDAGVFWEQLEKNADTMTNRYFLAYRLFVGSMQITKKFFQYIKIPGNIVDHLETVAKLAENISSVIKKFELTGRLNYSFVEEKMRAARDQFYNIIEYVHSETLVEHLTSLSLSEVAKQTDIMADSSNEYMDVGQGGTFNQHQIDISSYYNNQAFGYSNSSADLTGGGEFFLLDGRSSLQGVVVHKDIEFSFCKHPGHGNDNVTCQGQVIPIDCRVYNGIWLLGCAEWGNAKGYIGIQFEDGDVEHIPAQLTDWAWRPRFGEAIVMTLPVFRKVKMAFVPDEGHIFAVHYPITREKRACKLLLPNCPNFHIFSIVMTSFAA